MSRAVGRVSLIPQRVWDRRSGTANENSRPSTRGSVRETRCRPLDARKRHVTLQESNRRARERSRKSIDSSKVTPKKNHQQARRRTSENGSFSAWIKPSTPTSRGLASGAIPVRSRRWRIVALPKALARARYPWLTKPPIRAQVGELFEFAPRSRRCPTR